MNNRIYDTIVDIDTSKISEFFDSRAAVAEGLSSVMLRTSDDGVAQKRNTRESEILKSLLGRPEPKYILDIGCGIGRWADNLKEYVKKYDGIDFSKNYINRARAIFIYKKNTNFYQMSADSIDRNIINQSYDVVIVTALCIYLNECSIDALFAQLEQLAMSKDSRIYIRESVSTIGKRLTLKDFPSAELDQDYSAIYRTPEEYELLIKKYLPNFEIVKSEYLLDKETGAREETNQKYWFLRRIK